jgi:Flp pilus assembly pilin Flp
VLGRVVSSRTPAVEQAAGASARLHRHLAPEEGQALVEYALILALTSLAAIALLTAVGQNIIGLLARVTSVLASAV